MASSQATPFGPLPAHSPRAVSLVFASLFIILGVFVYGYQRHAISMLQQRLSLQGTYVSKPMWHLDQAASLAKLEQIVRVEQLLRGCLRHGNGDVFAEFANPSPSLTATDRVLQRVGLMPMLTLEMPLRYRDYLLGVLEVQWLNRSVYGCLHATLLALLAGVTALFYLSLRENYRRLTAAAAVLASQEHELRQSRDELELRVCERTRELTVANEKLQQETREHQLAETALRNSQLELEAAQQIAHLGSWRWDMVDGRMSWSPLLFEICALSPATVPTYEGLLTAVHDDDRANLAEAMRDVVHGRSREFRLDLRIQRPDGSLRYVVATCNRMTAADRPGPLLGTLLDVTERRIFEERLRQAEKMEAIGQLAGGVAHDFNNQLCGIMGYADMLVLRLENPLLRNYAEAILTAAQSAAVLTNDLMAFAQRGRFLSVPVDLHRVVAEASQLLSRSLDKTICIRQVLQAENASVTGDPSQLQNVLLNLAINARDAMPGGGEIVFSSRNQEVGNDPSSDPLHDLPAGRYVCLSVIDSGCGMSPEAVKRIFEPFFSTRSVDQSAGIGLASAYGVIRNHHGTITVESHLGAGTAFRVFLPVLPAPAGQPMPQETTPAVAGGRILVVDDEPVMRGLLRDMLDQLGYKVTVCANGKEAVACYRTNGHEIAAVIADLILPDVSGAEVLAAIRGVNPDARILLASGCRLSAAVQDLVAQANGVLQKPFVLTEVAGKVAAALR